ncbi:MAG: sulfotransferase domain-containing protein [gamma proteobacterium symbiont of Taylorina sp.]|nr:sulfotransferase domain-containing protein [gamma proteobacterium symbiont of Taylorina sp.]
MKQLDFIIIGAQKSATTSLFKYLSEHPEIQMPGDKEAPFFSDDQLYEKGWDSFCRQYFNASSEEQLWGTATPQYMGDPRAAERIAAQNPQVRLIAILRNPIERAYSHYTMSVRREVEHRDFSHAVDALLSAEHLEKYRNEIPPDHHKGYSLTDKNNKNKDNNYYFVWSEYGRILTNFRKYFSAQQLLILYMDDLMEQPQQTLDKVIQFLGIKTQFSPANLGKIYHQGGNKLIIPNTWKEKIKKNSIFRFFWDQISPRRKGYLNYWYEQLNVYKSKSKSEPSRQLRQKLIHHFYQDIKQLEQLFDSKVPWQEFNR